AVDALAATTHYDEFVIVSADADFTPLALRCRAADRRVTIVTASPAASAYRAVADEVVAADDLAALLRTSIAEDDAAPAAAAVASGPEVEAAPSAATSNGRGTPATRERPAEKAAPTEDAKASKVDLVPLQRQITTVTDV